MEGEEDTRKRLRLFSISPFFFFCNQEFALGLVGPTLSSRNSPWASRETT